MQNVLHESAPVYRVGAEVEKAPAVMVMLHGRGASAESILTLADEFTRPDLAYIAPQAANATWYPNRFTAPVQANQPWLDSALAKIGTVLESLRAVGVPVEKTVLLGFSQGACLALEYAARNPQRYGGVVALSGGLIGEGGTALDHAQTATASLDATPVFIGVSDRDFHIPLVRVQESDAVLKQMGAAVNTRVYPGMGHTVNQEEIDAVKAMLSAL